MCPLSCPYRAHGGVSFIYPQGLALGFYNLGLQPEEVLKHDKFDFNFEYYRPERTNYSSPGLGPGYNKKSVLFSP